MEPDVFALLLGFTLAKMAIAAGIVWLGVRSPERPPDGGGGGDPQPRVPAPRPPRPERTRRGGPARRRTVRARARARRGAP